MENLTTLATELKQKVEHQEFPAISGKPTFAQIREMQRMTETNAGCIDCNLPGVGAYNYLHLTRSDADWTTLTSLAPVIPPVRPPDPTYGNSTAAQIATINQAYNRNKKQHDEYQALKQLLLHQITKALDKKWVKPLRNRHTNRLDRTIPEVYEFLYTRYGRIQSSVVREKEDELLAIPVDLQEPLILLFDDIEDFVVLCRAAKVPKTTEQIIDLTLTILKNCGVFSQALQTWRRRPTVDQTWANLKDHFDDEHQALLDTTDLTMGATSFQQANELVEAIQNDVKAQMDTFQHTIQHALQLSTNTTEEEENQENIPPPVNGSTYTPRSSELKNQMQSMFAAFDSFSKEMKTELGQLKKKTKQTTRNPRKRKETDTSDVSTTGKKDGEWFIEGRKRRRVIDAYCWSHGACTHSSMECELPQEGHKKTATFANKQGGSTAFCQFVN